MIIKDVEKDEDFPKESLALRDQQLVLWHIVSQPLIKGAQTSV